MNSLVAPIQLFDVSPREDIEVKTRLEIEAYISVRKKTHIHAGARNLSLNVSDDYGNRFLVELIQNAHDAHDQDRHDGEIAVVLDPHDGEHGCLYVANRGNGFTKRNLEAITNIALSSKSVNESIGNKGLGFRSVLQICQRPEIYSVHGVGGKNEFDGYCFRFADEGAIEALLDSQPNARDMAQEIIENMPCWYLPVYAEDRPGLVKQFADEGFASVVRMPLETAKARESVDIQINELLALKTPLHLFLDRISRINIEREPGQAESLERCVIGRWSIPGGVVLEKIAIGSDNYLLATTEIEPVLFREQLDKSLTLGEVPESWGKWQGCARVSTAIRLGHSVEKGLLYCFLPLGEAGLSPFAGYINANFYTKMDRRSVKDGVGLNQFFVGVAAEVNCQVIRFLIEQNWDESAGAVADLLCWNGKYAGAIRDCFEKVVGDSMFDHPLLPTCNPTGQTQWVKASDAYIWDMPSEACLSADVLTREANAAILSDSLTLSQKQSLRSFFSVMGISFEPAQSIVAGWIESVAAKLLENGADPLRWASFYDEVTQIMRKDPKQLYGKRFLLSVNGDLIASEPTEGPKRRRTADIYFPPVMAMDSDNDDPESKSILPLEQLPASLKRGFSLLSRDVPWLNDDGGYRPARAFFLESKLVREYDTRDVIRTLASVTQAAVADRTKEQALEWAFRLWSSGRSLSPKETRASGFYIPTRGGWLSAESVMFGNGWAVPNGKRLELMLKAGEDYSEEIASARGNLLHHFEKWPVHYGTEVEWVSFLQAAGVQDCLRPIGGETRIQLLDFQPLMLAHQLAGSVDAIKDSVANHWRSDLFAAARKARFSTCHYRSELHPWRLPGQLDLEIFPEELRKDYAVQVVRALPNLKPEHLKFRIFRPGNPSSGPVPEQWPTPLFSLLRTMAWLPVARGRGTVRFVAPNEAWHFYTDEETPPRFMELVVPSVAKDLNEKALDLLRNSFGLRVLNDEGDAISALSCYADRASEELSDPSEVKRFRELFGKVWTQIASLDQGLDLNCIPVMTGGKIRALPRVFDENEINEHAGVAHFVDEDDSAKRQLLEELAQPLFDFGKANIEDTWMWLEAFAPGRFVRMSHEQLEVHVDGERFEVEDVAPLLTEVFGIWIADFIVCAAEHKGGAFFTKTQSNLGKVKRAALSLQLHTGKHLQISMGGKVRDLPGALHGAVVLRRNGYTVLIAEIKGNKPTLNLLSQISDQLALALQQPILANGLDASFLRLAQLMRDGEGDYPDDEDIAQALGTDIQSLEQTRRYARADLSTHIRFSMLLAAYHGLESCQERLLELVAENDLNDDIALEALQPIAEARCTTVANLVEKLELVSDLHDLMQVFDLSLSDLNNAIRHIGGEFRPVSNEVLHARQLKAYLSLRNSQIIERLRGAFLDVYDRGENLSKYAQLRDAVSKIEPNPDWYEQYDDLPDEVLDEHLNLWLNKQGISVSVDGFGLPSLHVSRETNAARLREFWSRFGKILSVLVQQEGYQGSPTLRATWSDSVLKRQEYAALANQAGMLDFRLLGDVEIAKWLESQGVWLPGYPVSTVFSDWGLSEDEIENNEAKADRDREAKRKSRLKLSFGERDFSAQIDDYHVLITAVNEALKDSDALADINTSLRKYSDFDEPSRSGGGSGNGSSGKGSRSADSSLSDEQKSAVGLIGELYAKEWIKRYHLEKHKVELDDECWVSSYRNVALGTNSGNDNLGYDFAVQLKSSVFYYEVKASMGDSQIFEMGPTEIGAAQRYKSDKDSKFRILYVANATDPKRTKISLLPNPFSRGGLKKLRPVGRGSVTYAFDTL